MKARHWITLTAVLAGGLALSACAGALPEDFSLGVESAEASELEFTAPIDAMGPDAWTIGGITVAVTSVTEVSGDPQVGDMVKVHATAWPDVGLVAREIEPLSRDATPGGNPAPAAGEEIEFFGNVVSIGVTEWTIGARVLAVTPQTEIKGPLATGDLAKVHAIVQPDGSLVAREIEPAAGEAGVSDDSSDDDGDHLEFRGLVERVGADTWVVAGMTFRVLPGTEIKDPINVGDFVKVEAVWSSDGTLTAVEIEHEDESELRDLDDDDSPDDSDDDDHDDDDDDDDDHDDDDDDDDNSGSGSGSSGSG